MASWLLNLPTKITILRVLLVPPFVVFLLLGQAWSDLSATACFLAASVSDGIDGYLARRTGQITVLGKLLDPLADKLLVTAAYVSLVQLGRAPAWMVIVILSRELAVTGLRAMAASQGLVIPAETLGKYKMFAQAISIVGLSLYAHTTLPYREVGTAALWAVLVLSSVSGAQHFYRFWKKSDLSA